MIDYDRPWHPLNIDISNAIQKDLEYKDKTTKTSGKRI
jgi:hypothetical protein